MQKMMRRLWRPLILALPLIPLAMLVAVARAEPDHEREMILVQGTEKWHSQFELVRYFPDTQQYQTAVMFDSYPDTVTVIDDTLYYFVGNMLWRVNLNTFEQQEIMPAKRLRYIGDPQLEWLLVDEGNQPALLNTRDLSILRPFPTLPTEMTFQFNAELSPDRNSIAFTACTDTLCDVYVVHLDGTGLFNVTSAVDQDVFLSGWAGTGAGWIILLLNGVDLYKIRPSGEGFEKIISDPAMEDGWETFVGNSKEEIYRDWVVISTMGFVDVGGRTTYLTSRGVNLNDASLQWATSQPLLAVRPSNWDGEWLTLIGDNQLFRIHPDGTGLTPLMTLPSANFVPLVWSPDGRWLYLGEYTARDHFSLYRIRADGEQLTFIASLPRSSDFFTWSPDGWMIFDSPTGLVRVKTDGSEQPSHWPHLPEDSGFVAWGDTYEVKRSSVPLYGLAGATTFMAIGAGYVAIYRPYRKARRLPISGDTAGQ